MPFYQLNIPEVYKTWNFSERFPDHNELRAYMSHIDKTLDLRKDVAFNARVVDCSWDPAQAHWTVKTLQGHVAHTKYLFCASGLLHRTYTPDFVGLKDYKGEVHHSGAWPADFDGTGKKIAVIGAGATAVQITQELGKVASEMTVFVRRPSYCLPMQQRKYTAEEQTSLKPFYGALFKEGRDSLAGFPISDRPEGSMFDASVQEREARFDAGWKQGGFHFSLGGWPDPMMNPEANEIMYQYWRRRVCERLTDPAKQAIMAPEKKPYYFNTKRSPLEQDYYEVLNQENVTVHDLNAAPLQAFYEKGLIMADGSRHEFDAVALATGFDSYSGSMTQMGLKSKDGVDLKDIWGESGVNSYLGMTVSGFPNM